MPFFYISAPYLFGSREGTLKEICEVVLVKNIATGREITSL